MATRPRWILPAIAISQFAGTALWFAGNAVLPDLQREWELAPAAVGDLTTAVQLGFIGGTLVFALFAIADLFSPRKLFLVSALAGAGFNAAAAWIEPPGLTQLLILRFLTGFCLAGIYPVGMKIASGWYRADLGRALGYLVGALVLGTALPHLIRALGAASPAADWRTALLAVSAVSALGGALMALLVPDGPYLIKGARFDPRALATIFRSPRFRASSFGYFGHMWELYAFWAFAPALIAAHDPSLGPSFWSFAVIAAGALGCVLGGIASLRLGGARVAAAQLSASALCCVLAPLMIAAPTPLFLAYLLFWGVVVVGDSPQFSALNATFAPPALVGSALTIVNSIGFAITIVSIQLLNHSIAPLGAGWAMLLLAPGPLLGLWALRPLLLAPRAQLSG